MRQLCFSPTKSVSGCISHASISVLLLIDFNFDDTYDRLIDITTFCLRQLSLFFFAWSYLFRSQICIWGWLLYSTFNPCAFESIGLVSYTITLSSNCWPTQFLVHPFHHTRKFTRLLAVRGARNDVLTVQRARERAYIRSHWSCIWLISDMNE